MMKRVEDMNYYEVLEVSPTASVQELHRAYERVRRIYEPNSLAFYSIFTPEEVAAIRKKIEEAYHLLSFEDKRRHYDAALREKGRHPIEMPPVQTKKPEADSIQPMLPLDDGLPLESSEAETPSSVIPEETAAPSLAFIEEYTGPTIKALREQRRLSLQDIATQTKISLRYLDLIEAEEFAKLPVRTYLRGFLILYAKALGCDPDRMSSDYIKRFEAATKPARKK